MSEPVSSSAWYLITGNGDLSLRLRDRLIIGEDEQGELAIDSPLVKLRQLRLIPGDGCVQAEVLAADRHLTLAESEDLALPDPSSLDPGTSISLDHNIIYLNTGIADATALTHLRLRDKPAAQPEPPAADLAQEEDPVETIVAEVRVAEPAAAPATRTERPAAKPRRTRIVVNLLIGLMVLGALIAYNHYQATAPQPVQQQAQTDPVAEAPAPEETSEIEIVSAQTLRTEPAPEEPEPEEPVAEPPALEPAPIDPLPTATVAELPTVASEPQSAPDPLVERRMANARALLDAGQITEPPGNNAVYELKIVLYREPENEAALALMGEAAERMLVAATTAYDAGLEFEARNLLEELLAFHPDHAEANRLWAQWTGSPRT